MIDARFWRNRVVLVTGHTGFKGAWLCAWLQALGARVSGLALPPDTSPNLHGILSPRLEHEHLGDIRIRHEVAGFVKRVRPQIVLHLAAQALVRQSYLAPVETYETNVVGTANLLDALRHTSDVEAVVVVTTDKVYENDDQGTPFDEDDPLGGHDPYSASKACAEILAASYRRSFFSGDGAARVATARSGNVIGGGDWATDRIVADIVRAIDADSPVTLRYPDAVRPWLHVLEPLAGYMMMAQALVNDRDFSATKLNFAPEPTHMHTVADVVAAFSTAFGGKPGWERDGAEHVREATLLALSPAAARATLGWRPRLDFAATVAWTAAWYSAWRAGDDMHAFSMQQIGAYQRLLDEAALRVRDEPEYSSP